MSNENQGRILVVDDNEMNRDMLSRRLQRQGYEVMVAEHGARAIEVMQSEPVDLVLLDIMMPKMNGYEVLEQVKVDDHLRQIPIIMISAMDDLDSVVRCIELGAEDYLFKPFNPVLLKARVSSSLDKKRARDQLAASGGANSPASAHLQAVKENLQTLLSGRAGPLTEQQEALIRQALSML